MTSNINIESEWEYYYPKVYGYFFRRLNTREDIEDLTSLVLINFLQVIMDEDKIKKIQNKHAYLWKIAHNYLVTFINTKSKKPVPISLDENVGSVDQEIEDNRSEGYKQRVDSLIECIKGTLKETEYQIVYLSIYEDMKSPQIAKKLNLTSANVRKKLSRSLDKVRKICAQIWN